MRPLRVVQVVPHIGWRGGMQEYVAGLSRGLHQLGHEVVILSGGDGPPRGPSAHYLADGIKVVWHPRRRVFGRYPVATGLWASLRHYGRWADVVHVHQAGFSGSWLAILTGKPLAGTLYLHPEHIDQQVVRKRIQLRLLLRQLDLLVTVSQAERELASEVVRLRNACTVWPGLEVQQPIDGSPRPRRVLWVSRMVPSKGVELFLRAASLLPSDVEVMVVGSGPAERHFRDIAASLELSASVFAGGDLDDQTVEQLMDQTAVFVSASLQESFGIATMKAISRGVRPLVSDIPSHREIVAAAGLSQDALFDAEISGEQLAGLILSALEMPPISAVAGSAFPEWRQSAEDLVTHYRRIVRRGVSASPAVT